MQELTFAEQWDAALFKRKLAEVRACISEDGKIHLDNLFIPKWYNGDSKTCD